MSRNSCPPSGSVVSFMTSQVRTCLPGDALLVTTETLQIQKILGDNPSRYQTVETYTPTLLVTSTKPSVNITSRREKNDTHFFYLPPRHDPGPALLIIVQPTPYIPQSKRLTPQVRETHTFHHPHHHFKLDRRSWLSRNEIRLILLPLEYPSFPTSHPWWIIR